MMNISGIKGIILVLMLVVTFICSMIPVCFVNHIHHTHDSNRRSKYHHILSFLSCIAGGVFMGTCILDLFPDVQEQIDILLSQYTLTRPFPLAEFIVVFGFLLVLTMEQIVLDYKERALAQEINSETQTLLHNNENVRGNLQLENSLSGISDHPDLLASLRHSDHVRTYGSVPRSCDGTDQHEHADIFDHSIHQDISSHSPLRSFLLLFALSLHSIFEGMAVGLQSTIDNLLGLFMVVIFHKGILALSLSINMVQSRLSMKQMVLGNMFFCVTAPFGVGVGIGIMEMKHSISTTLLSGVLQGIACGTFLYVTFFEVLPHEMNNGENRLPKLFFILLGFSLVCAMLYIAPEDEKYHCYKV